MTPIPKVPVGLGTYAGLGTAFTAFGGGIVAIFLNGDYTEETITAFATGTVTLVTTLIGRFSQAKAQITTAAVVAATSDVPVADTADAMGEDLVMRGVGDPDEPYDIEDFDPAHEERDIHDATGV